MTSLTHSLCIAYVSVVGTHDPTSRVDAKERHENDPTDAPPRRCRGRHDHGFRARPHGRRLTVDKPEYIVGGSQASNPSVVQLVFTQDGGQYGCTGEVIAAQWVLTARHCTEGSSRMKVYTSNSTTNPGTPVSGDRLVNSPYGDVGLVHLAKLVGVNPMPIASSYTAQRGQTGVISGYGLRANSRQSTGLFKANVTVLGSSTDAYRGRAIHVQGIDGASNHGDSGGPLVINGQIVGVCSTGDTADPGSNIHAGSNYSNITGHRAWIRQTAGV